MAPFCSYFYFFRWRVSRFLFNDKPWVRWCRHFFIIFFRSSSKYAIYMTSKRSYVNIRTLSYAKAAITTTPQTIFLWRIFHYPSLPRFISTHLGGKKRLNRVVGAQWLFYTCCSSRTRRTLTWDKTLLLSPLHVPLNAHHPYIIIHGTINSLPATMLHKTSISSQTDVHLSSEAFTDKT